MKIALIGYGKMGKAIEMDIPAGDTIVARIDKDNAGDLDKLAVADVAMEFSTPGSAPENVGRCFDAGIPVVCGTTGWSDEMLGKVRERCLTEGMAMVYASNFSIGVNLFFETAAKLAEYMNGYPSYDVHIEETHHAQKLDAPSGTAITAAGRIIEKIERKKQWVKGQSIKKDDLVIISRRIGDEPGTHEIMFASEEDQLKLSHLSYSRKGFARGALTAARWIIGKKGFYGMGDVLNLK